ncbi:hypothetical protein DYH09_14805 [bacterium CPR1]|nr:hypothetical protein [bacterium CPR1]
MQVRGPRPSRHLTAEERRKLEQEAARREEIYQAAEELRSTSDQRSVVDRHHRQLHDTDLVYGTETSHRTTSLTDPEVLFTTVEGFTTAEQSKIVEQAVRPKHEQLEQRVDLASGVSVVAVTPERALEIQRPDGVTRRYEESHIERLPYDADSSLVLSQWSSKGVVEEIAPNGTIYLVDRSHGAMVDSSDHRSLPDELKDMKSLLPYAFQANTYVITPDGNAFGFEFRMNRPLAQKGQPWPRGTLEYVRVPARLDDQGVLQVDRSQVPELVPGTMTESALERVGGREQIPLLLRPDELQGGQPSPEAIERYQRSANEEIVVFQPQGPARSAGIQEQGGQLNVGGVRIKKRGP